MSYSRERLRQLVRQLSRYPGLAGQLPSVEGAIVRDALDGLSVSAIAHEHAISEEAVWGVLSNAARFAAGYLPQHPIETGGLGSDTDPGVTGGYGDTGFGSLGNEPPIPVLEEPEEGIEYET
jgi:hypothetical protein